MEARTSVSAPLTLKPFSFFVSRPQIHLTNESRMALVGTPSAVASILLLPTSNHVVPRFPTGASAVPPELVKQVPMQVKTCRAGYEFSVLSLLSPIPPLDGLPTP